VFSLEYGRVEFSKITFIRQCGRFPKNGIHQTCKRYWKIKETTSKTRTADAGGKLEVIVTDNQADTKKH